ncbi:T9SS type A sorting domain-containing protein [Flavobacterium chilense]|uniref:Por secretion system C-terminal sorting domain-containing protein n=1 Tax=Flavobacterium chilense TaxID=946677 RepID=A0A1M6YJB1_9FLAO|nr:T9SS type A sorting domain-containing protein [Flavobacterium chilense]SHL18327.1 Por secretion system C-terminal sorting domain-containing protein [Flavobacterium chilense]
MKKHYLLLLFFMSLFGYSQQADINGAKSVTIINPPALVPITGNVTNVTGAGLSDGTISLNTISGGTPGYTVNWSNITNPLQPVNINALKAGTYRVKVNDANGCFFLEKDFTVYQPDQIEVIINQPAKITCFGNNGSLTAQAKGGYPYGGSPNYTYSWFKCDNINGDNPVPVNGTGPQLLNVKAGFYMVHVIDNQNATIAKDIKELTQNPKILVNEVITPISCRGAATGAINLTPSGGTPNTTYTVVWSDNTSIRSFERTGLTAGTYRYTITDDQVSGCSTVLTTVTVSEPALDLNVTYTSKQPTLTNNNGQIILNATGGILPGGNNSYTYQWSKVGDPTFSPGNVSQKTDLANGTYNINVTSSSGCTFPVITIKLEALNLEFVQQVNVKCFGDATGLIAVKGIGGTITSDYDYTWFKNGAPIAEKTSTLTGITSGTFRVEIRDSKGDMVEETYNITQPAAPLLVSSSLQQNVSCKNGSNGKISTIVSGGTIGSGYKYLWSNGSTQPTADNLIAGKYSLTVTDANGCQAFLTDIEITEPLTITIPAATITHVAIFGESTGAITLGNVTGGNGGYNYNWSSSTYPSFTSSTKDISGLKTGSYTLLVTDSKSCTATQTFIVNQNSLLEVEITESKFIKCYGNTNGELTAVVKGGVTPYKYVWTKNGTVIPGENTAKISNLGFGFYSVYVTDNANPSGPFALAQQLNYELKQPNELKVTALSQTNVLCYGAATGAININITGGTGPYTQQWTKNGIAYSVGADLSDLETGTYNVIVTDRTDHGCTATLAQAIVITQPTAPLKIESVTPVNLTGFETNNGSISVTVSGGKPNYNYQWTKDTNPAIIGSGPSITGLSIGIYHLIVKDDNGCTLPQADYEITQPAKFEIVSITQTSNTNIACFGDTSAEFNAVVTGGVKEYTFEWLNTTNGVKHASSENISPTSTVSKASNLPAGNYVITVKDAKNNILFGTNTFTILQPDKLAFTYTKTNVSCFQGSNGSIKLNITGGTKFADITKPYTIISSGIIDSQNGIISGLTQGTYTVKIIDANGCQTAEQTIIITEPANSVFINNQTITPTTGFGLSTGKIVITVAGGTAGYSYQWKNSLGFTVGTNSPVLNNIPAGTYTVLVTDANSCTTTNSYTVEQPTKPLLTETHIQARCNGLLGSLDALATGGATFGQNQSNRIYTYKLKNKTTNAVITIVGNEAKFENISDGDYTLTATDVGGVDSNNIDVTFKQPTPIIVNLDSKLNVSCFDGQDGSIIISVTGGTPFIINNAPVYNYQWKKKNKATNIYENFTPSALNALTEGTYAVEVRDANYNSADASHCVGILDEIIITQPADFGFDIDKITYINPSAQNGNDGALHFEIKGGKTNYEYKLYTKNAQGNETILKTISNTSAKMVDFTDLIKDHYYVSVQDDTGCTKYTDFDFTDNPLTITISQTQDMTCFESNDAIIKATVNGGFGVKKISWYLNNVLLPNENNTELLNAKIGTYYAVVKDSKTIEVTTAPITITQPDLVTFTTIQEPVKCLGDNNGSISITAAGGNGTYKYRYFQNGTLIKDWTSFVSGAKTIITDLADGEYTLQVQDTQQCKSTDATVKITSPTALTISNVVSVPATGKGLSNGSITITAQGSNGNYTYKWFKSDATNLNQTAPTAANLAAGKYYVIITDAKNCSLTSELLEVTEPALLETNIEVQNVILCNGDKNGSLKPTTIGGFLKPGESYTYQWFENGNATPLTASTILSGIGKGSYYTIVTDSNGNKAKSKVLIIAEPLILDNTLTSDYMICGDANDWTINATPSGGTLPYNYVWNTGAKTATIQNVPPGNYSVLVTDNHGCTITKIITIVAPVHLATSEVIKIPTCYAGSDATITLTSSGGKAPYTYLWNTGEKSNVLSNASAGDYNVMVTDSKGCMINHTYTIVNPPKDIINLGEDVTLCFDQTLTINATIDDVKATYAWTSDKGFKSNKAMITVSQPANYTVIVTNKLGCEATDTIKISSQSTAISAEFAVSSQVFKNEKFILVDISNPAADEIEWILPANATIVSKNKDFAEISFNEAGQYDVTMNTKKGDCTAYQTKTILVTEGEFEENNPDEVSKKFDLKIYPNPSKGTFTVDVLLDKVMPAHVKVFNLNNNMLIDSKTQDGKDNYLFNFSFNGLPSGVYFVLFESQQGSKLRKIIIQ